METIYALGIMFAALTMGLILVAVVLVIMGISGAPGAMLFDAGQKRQNALVSNVGFFITALAQSFVVGAYSVFVVSLLRTIAEAYPGLPTWPLWIAAFFHSVAVPMHGMKERPEEPTAQHHTLGIVSLMASIVFFLMAFTPNTLSSIYGWVPFYEEVSRPPTMSKMQKPQESRALQALTDEQMESAQSFFVGYQHLLEINKIAQRRPGIASAKEDLNRIKTLIVKAQNSLGKCNMKDLNDIHFGWGDITKNKFIPALLWMKLEIVSPRDKQSFAKADVLLADFDTWLRINWDLIAQKVGE